MSIGSDEKQQDEKFFGAGLRKAAIQAQDIQPMIDVVAEVEPPTGVTPYGQGKNLQALTKARDELLSGAIKIEEYGERVAEVHQVIELAVSIFEHPPVIEAVEQLPPEEIEIIGHIKAHTRNLMRAIDLLTLYQQSEDLEDMEQGMEMVEDAMRALTAIQCVTAKKGLEEFARAEAAVKKLEAEPAPEVTEDAADTYSPVQAPVEPAAEVAE